MNIFEQFGSDTSLERSGVWVDIGTAKFKLARAGGANDDFLKLVRKRMAPFKRAIEAGSLDEGFAKKIQREVFAETVVLGWKNVFGPDGEIPYSRENCIDLLEKLPNLMTELQRLADTFETFRQENLEADAKN